MRLVKDNATFIKVDMTQPLYKERADLQTQHKTMLDVLHSRACPAHEWQQEQMEFSDRDCCYNAAYFALTEKHKLWGACVDSKASSLLRRLYTAALEPPDLTILTLLRSHKLARSLQLTPIMG